MTAAVAAGVAVGSSSSATGGRWIAFHADPAASGDLYLDSEDGTRRRRLTTLFGQIPTAAWSPDGTRFAMLARARGVVDVYVMGMNGRGLRQLTRDEGDHFGYVAWSPDGRRLTFTCCGERRTAIYVIGADGSGRKRLADDSAQPIWSPDGRRIVFISLSDGDPELYSMNSDGSDKRRLTSNQAEDVDPTWSPDGRRIAFTSKRDGRAQIYVIDSDGSNQRRLIADRWSDQNPHWSPDGRQVMFTSFRNRDPNLLGIGNAEILVANADGSGLRNLTRSASWEGEPDWAPDGKQIAYAVRSNFGPLGSFRIGVMNADGTGKRLLPPVRDPRNPNGLANSCCPAWQPQAR